MNSLVSILIPAYNAERWLGDAIRSALDQTWPCREIIVVDDGSIDGTRAVADAYKEYGIKVIGQDNRGASAARNTALRESRGDFIQWLDADDILAADKIELQLKAHRADGDTNTLLSSEWGLFRRSVRRVRFVGNRLWQDLAPADWFVRSMEDNTWMAIETWLVSRELAERAGPWDTRLVRGNDGEYFARVICRSGKIRFVPEARTFVRATGSGSLSSDYSVTGAKLNSIFLSLSLQIRHMLSMEDSDRTRRAGILLLQRWLVCFPPDQRELVGKMSELARELGGELQLSPPQTKQNAMAKVLGRTVSGYLCAAYRNAKDWALYGMDRLRIRS